MNIVFVNVLYMIGAIAPSCAMKQICSKYPFDEKMLEKVIKVEAKMELWDKELKRFEEVIFSVLEHRREELEKQLETFSEENKKIREIIKNKTSDEDIGNPIIAFNAYTKVSGNYPKDNVIKFPEVLLNEGEGFDPTSGKFTAPVPGLYHFTAHVCNEVKQAIVISIMHGENKIAAGTEYEDNDSSCSSLSAPAIMETGEHVYVKSLYGANYMRFNEFRWPSFMGVLVQRLNNKCLTTFKDVKLSSSF